MGRATREYADGGSNRGVGAGIQPFVTPGSTRGPASSFCYKWSKEADALAIRSAKVHTWFTPKRILCDGHISAKVYTKFRPERTAIDGCVQRERIYRRSPLRHGATGVEEG